MNSLEVAFPGLTGSGYTVTSAADGDYNCLAWAAGENDRWWWPDPMGIDYWPPGVPREETLAAFIQAYATLAFALSADATPEANVEKIAIYALSGRHTHAARQLSNGRWTSKLGECQDIEHELNDLVGTIYGSVEAILARPRITSPADAS